MSILCILIDLLCARFDEIGEKKRAVRYTVDILQSLSLPFYPMFVNIVKQQHGDMAEVVLEELLHQGSSFKDSLLDICLIRLQTSVKDKHTVTMETLDSIFEVFLKYLLCSAVHGNLFPSSLFFELQCFFLSSTLTSYLLI